MTRLAYLLQAIRTFDTACLQDAITHVQRTVDHVMACIADAAARATRADAQSTVTAETLTRAARAVLVPRAARKLTSYLRRYRDGQLTLRFTGMVTLLRQRIGSLHLSQQCGNVMRAALQVALWTVLEDARAAMRARKGVSITANDVRNSVRKHGPIVAPAPKAAPAKRKRATSPKRKRAASPKRKRAASPKRKRATSPKRKRAASPKRKRAASPKRKRATSPKRKRAASPKRTRTRAASTPRAQKNPQATLPDLWRDRSASEGASWKGKGRPWKLPAGYTLVDDKRQVGGQGEVAMVKHRGKIYVAKRAKTNQRNIAKENNYAVRAAELGVGPRVVYHDKDVLIMERMEEILPEYLWRTTPEAERAQGYRAMTTEEMDEIVKLVTTCLEDGWMHSDMKRDNVMYGRGRLFMVDFGMAKSWDPKKHAKGMTRAAAIRQQALQTLHVLTYFARNRGASKAYFAAIKDYVAARGHVTPAAKIQARMRQHAKAFQRNKSS